MTARCLWKPCRGKLRRSKNGRPMRFCGPHHYELWRQAKRRDARGARSIRRRKHNGFVTRARNEVKGRVCLMCCTTPLRGNQRVCCGSADCWRSYWAEHKREQRAAR